MVQLFKLLLKECLSRFSSNSKRKDTLFKTTDS